MNTRLTWKLDVINWNDIKSGKFGGDICCNTCVDTFFTLQDVWDSLGFKMTKKGGIYRKISGGIEYRLYRR